MELQSLLKRLRRSCRSSPDVGAGAPSLPQRPPDEGSAALGYQLGSAFASALLGCAAATSSSDIDALRKVGCNIIDALSAAPSSSFAVGYFSGVHMTLCDDQISATALSAALEAILSWCLTWIEQSDPAIRSALIRGFAHLTHLSANDVDPNTLTLADAYSKLKRGIDRRLLVRESVVVSFSALRRDVRDGQDSAGTTVIAHLSGLMARCVLLPADTRATDGANCFNRDGPMFWTALLRECRLFVSSTAPSSGQLCANVMATILPWLVQSFQIYSLRLSWNDGIVVDEAFAMFQQLCDLLCDVSPRRRRGLFEDSRLLCPAIEEVSEILCRFSTSGQTSIAPCIIQLSEAMCSAAIESSSAISPLKVSDVVVFRLALLALNAETSESSKQILESIFQLIISRCFDGCCGKVVVVGSVRALGRTFASVTSHARIAAKLCRIADEIEDEGHEEGIGPDKSISPDQIVRLFQSSSSELNSNSMLSKLIVPVTLELTSPTEQMCVFLVASSLLCTKTRSSGGDTEKNFELLQQIVERWPHLGVRSIPLATSFIQAAVTQEDCDVGVIPALRFLCSAASIDPSCAQQVWSLTSALTEHPSVVRIASIRTFSSLCKANRKLYGRVRDRLGQYCSSPDTKTRIAATATLCDLAREDLIRDVSDIIGWLQIRLGDEEVIVVHYVLMTLHHLIRAGELDFDLVIKVISKKLVRCDDVFSILELSPIVVEALVVLLGDGAQSIGDGSDEDDSSDEDGEPSPQVKVAVSTLLSLAKEYKEKIDDDSESALRILNLIHSSLSGYNIGELGVEADALRSLLSCDDPSEPGVLRCIGYSSLKSIIMDGLVIHMPKFPDKASNDTGKCSSLEMLATTLLEFEEDTLGPSLWKKQGASKSSPAAKTKKQKLSKSVLGALPSAELLQSLYEENPSTGTAIARIFCLDHASTPISSTDELVDTLSEVLADLNVADMLDPLVMTLYYGAWLEAAKILWASISSADSGDCNFTEDAVTDALQQLDGLKEVDHDNALISMAAFCCIMPKAHQGVDLSSFADQVHESVLRAHNDHEFMDRNSAMVAFGLLGCRYSRLLAMDRIDQIIEIIDGSGIETKSFSALMSLALIARSLSASLVSIGKADVASSVALKMIGRILALIVDDLHLCFGASVPAMLTLIASLKTGKASPDLLESLHEIEDDTFLETDKTKMKMEGIFVVLSVALPALSQFDPIFLRASSVVLAKCPWNIGKGYAVASAYSSLADQNLLKVEDMDTAFAAAVGDASDSALYAASSISRLMPNNQDQNQEVVSMIHDRVGSEDSNDDILTACFSVGTIPLVSDLNGPYLHSETTKPALVTTVGMLTKKATDPNTSRGCRDLSAIVLGILCCMRNPRQSVMAMESQGSSSSISIKKTDTAQKKINDLPRPQEFTLLGQIIGYLREGLTSASSVNLSGEQKAQKVTESLPNRIAVGNLIRCIGCIPLPASFAALVKSIVCQVDTDEEELAVKDACLDMLVSQIECRRHSGSNRSEFISLSLQIAKFPPPTFWSLFRGRSTAARGLGRFMKATSYFIVNWPSGVVEETLENLWAICAFNMFEHATSFLNSLCTALRRCNDMDHSRTSSERKSNRTKSNVFSPAALKSIHKLLTGPIFMTLAPYVSGSGQAENGHGNATAGAWSSYLPCLEQIPASALNDANFFILTSNQGSDFDEGIARMLIIAHLAKCSGEYFGSETDKCLMKAQLWIARQRVTSLTKEQLKSIRLAMLHLGRGEVTPNNETSSQDCRKELVFQSFEAMLLHGLDSLALECLAVQCGRWCSSISTHSSAIEAHEAASSMSRVIVRGDVGSATANDVLSGDKISDIIGLFVRDLPWRLGSICRKMGGTASGLVTNRCLRILQGVAAANVEHLVEGYDLYNAALVTLKQSASCCCDTEANGSAYTSFYVTEML